MIWFSLYESCLTWVQGVSAGHCADWAWVTSWVPLSL
jgi:hypothetical protein